MSNVTADPNAPKAITQPAYSSLKLPWSTKIPTIAGPNNTPGMVKQPMIEKIKNLEKLSNRIVVQSRVRLIHIQSNQ